MNETDLISIICPVYKTEKFLKQCINSVLNQTYKNFELIMVSDASPDASVDIIKSFQKNDQRIKILVNKKNLGLSHTRFEGLKLATGKFVMHLDSDDWLPHNALEVLHHKITEEKADLVYGAITRVVDKYGLIKNRRKNNYSHFNLLSPIVQPVLFDEYYISYFGVNKLLVSMCAKLYRKSTIDMVDLQPTTMTMGEDLLYNLNLHPHLKKIAFVPETVYYYRFGGMTSKQNPTFLEDIKKQYYIKKEKIKEYHYNAALPYIKYELANCFYSFFLNQLLIDGIDRTTVEKNIVAELRDSVYKDLSDVDNAKAKAIYSKNSGEISDSIWKEYQNVKKKYQIKKFINRLLS